MKILSEEQSKKAVSGCGRAFTSVKLNVFVREERELGEQGPAR